MLIENLSESNVHAVAELETECFGDDAWSENLLRSELTPEKRYFVIRDGEKALAYGGFIQIFDEGHITRIAVSKDCRRQGLGQQILSTFFSLASLIGINSFTLEVRIGNVPARSLYEKNGFKLVGIRPKYYRDGEDCCIYWR